jgi:hypothetical protein
LPDLRVPDRRAYIRRRRSGDGKLNCFNSPN